MGPFSKTESNSEQSNTIATGSGRANRNSVVSQDGGMAFGRNSRVDFGIDFSRFNVGRNATVNLTFENSAEDIAQLSEQFAATQAQSQNVFAAGLSELSNAVFSQFAKLAETKATDGISGMSKTFLALAFGSLLLLGYLAYSWAKKGK